MYYTKNKRSIFFLIIAFLLIAEIEVNSQILKSIEKKVKSKTEERVNKEIDEKIDEIGNKEEEKDADSNQESSNQESSNNLEVKNEDEQSLKVYSQYDFVPGDQIVFYDDFSKDALGDFPALWTGTGSGEINKIDGIEGNWLKLTDQTAYYLMKDLNLATNFILEFDLVYDKEKRNVQFYLELFEGDGDYVKGKNLYYKITNFGKKGMQIEINNYRGEFGVIGYQNDNTQGKWIPEVKVSRQFEEKNFLHIIIWRQNRRLRIYTDGKKLLDGPTALPSEFNPNRLAFFARIPTQNNASNLFLSNLKFTTASPDTRHKLLTEGKFISYGIYFDIGKAVVKPESNGTINEIAKILNENPDLRIKITGHTDADGDDESNLTLSQNRAQAVKEVLVNEFKIDKNRIETEGLGETKPVAANDTPENKSKNRRVEFIKL